MVSNEDPGQDHQSNQYDTQSHKPARMDSADLLFFFPLPLPFLRKPYQLDALNYTINAALHRHQSLPEEVLGRP